MITIMTRVKMVRKYNDATTVAPKKENYSCNDNKNENNSN